MRQHRCQRVEVALRAHVHAVDDEVHDSVPRDELDGGLRERRVDQHIAQLQHGRLTAAVEKDPAPRGELPVGEAAQVLGRDQYPPQLAFSEEVAGAQREARSVRHGELDALETEPCVERPALDHGTGLPSDLFLADPCVGQLSRGDRTQVAQGDELEDGVLQQGGIEAQHAADRGTVAEQVV